jgi:prepilin-type N-terminal cleavage/methylation domain-containing protein
VRIKRSALRLENGDCGFTLTEMAVALGLTAILLTISVIVLNTFTQVQTGSTSSYAELDQLTPVGTSFQRLLRTAVSPATGGVGKAPIPPFGIYTAAGTLTPTTPISTSSLTFFSNTGTPNGPSMVKAVLTVPTPVRHPTVGIFTVTETGPEPGTCPGLGSPSTPTHPATARCRWAPTTTWEPTTKRVLRIDDVLVASSKPIFAFHLTPPLSNKPTGTPPGYGTPAETSPSPFATCTLTNCPADHIQSVTVDLEVHAPGAKNKVESETVTYQLSTESQTYSKAVG